MFVKGGIFILKSKRKLLIIISLSICLISIVISGCTDSNTKNSSKEIVSDEQYYKLVRTENSEFDYLIFDSKKNVVEKQSNITNPVSINMINVDVVDVEIGCG